jgi:pimeloyl-ACP methyl ester carboxylesterase
MISSCIASPEVRRQVPERGDPLPRKAALGVAFAPVNAEEAKAAGLPAGATAKVLTVAPGLTGQALGLKAGDILVEFGGNAMVGAKTVLDYLRVNPSGKQVDAKVLREGKTLSMSGKLIERPRMQPPADYDVRYDQVLSNGKRIRIIVTSPKGGKPSPTLFMIGGIGAYSIDGEFASTPYGNILATFAKTGYTVVRVDKPGQGDSEGPVYTELLFDDELDAYLQALRLVKTLPTVDKDRIAIFGHSMGGAFGPLIAAQEKVAGVAVKGTMSKTWVEYILENTRRQSLLAGAPAGAVDAELRKVSEVAHYAFNRGMSFGEIAKAHPSLAQTVQQMSPDGKTYSGVGLPFFQQLANKNLAEAWAKTDAKVLTLWGENDFISTEWDHEFVVSTVNAARPGTAKYQRVPESDHGFNKTTSQRDSMERWGKGGTFNDNIIGILKDWLTEVLA